MRYTCLLDCVPVVRRLRLVRTMVERRLCVDWKRVAPGLYLDFPRIEPNWRSSEILWFFFIHVQSRCNPGAIQVQSGYNPGTVQVPSGCSPRTIQVQPGHDACTHWVNLNTIRAQSMYIPSTILVKSCKRYKPGVSWKYKPGNLMNRRPMARIASPCASNGRQSSDSQ